MIEPSHPCAFSGSAGRQPCMDVLPMTFSGMDSMMHGMMRGIAHGVMLYGMVYTMLWGMLCNMHDA
eukprot:8018176-Lingulodinium_polyedra.AAC.1